MYKIHPGDGDILSTETGDVKWIQENIEMRSCRHFVKTHDESVIESEDPVCECGLRRTEHIETDPGYDEVDAVAERLHADKWDIPTHTTTKPTNSFGEIDFGYNASSKAKYVRLDYAIEADKVTDLLLKVWKLEKPHLLISIVGGVKEFFLKSHHREMFKRGLKKVVQSTGAWIVTSGVNSGVSKIVGEAMRDHELMCQDTARITTIGIASWGFIRENEKLSNPVVSKGRWPVSKYRCVSTERAVGHFLDPNHTHFLLIDTGKIREWKKSEEEHFISNLKEYNSFRMKFEKEVLRKVEEESAGDTSIPKVLVVMDGGLDTVFVVQAALDEGTPVVLMKGTGGATDLYIYAIENLGKHHKNTTNAEEWRERLDTMRSLIRQTNHRHKNVSDEYLKESLMSQIITVTMDNAENENYVTIFESKDEDFETQEDIDIAILQSLLKAAKDQEDEKMKLSISWNYINVTKNKTFQAEAQSMEEMMLSAIMLGRTDFIQLFLESGVNLESFLTKARLMKLYNNISTNSLLYNELMMTNKDQRMRVYKKEMGFYLQDVGNLLRNLLGTLYFPLYEVHWNVYVSPDLLLCAKDETLKNTNLFHMVMYGNKGKSGVLIVTNTNYRFDMDDIGVPYKIRIWSEDDNFRGFANGLISLGHMHPEYDFHITAYSDGNTGEIKPPDVVEVPLEGSDLPLVSYHVTIYTQGGIHGAETDANVYLTIYGDQGDTGRRWLNRGVSHANMFNAGSIDHFQIDAVSLKTIRKLSIGHDGYGIGAGWFLQKVEIYEDKSSETPHVFHFKRWLAVDEDDGHIEVTLELESDKDDHNGSQNVFTEDAARELFLYSLLTSRMDMAKLFWRRCNDPLASALVANSLLKAFAERVTDKKLHREMLGDAEEFNKLAISILNECYQANDETTLKLLVRSIPQWQDWTCVMIAVNADNREFLAQSACHSLLTDIWCGDISTDNSTLVILSCVVFPPLILPLIKLRNQRSVFTVEENIEKQSLEFLSQEHQSNKMEHGNSKYVDLSRKLDFRKTLEKVAVFYTAPIVSFVINVIWYMAFLTLYSYILLIKLEPAWSVEETLLSIWVFSILVEEIRQIKQPATLYKWSWKTLITKYIADAWNILDAIFISSYIVGIILRSLPNSETMSAARVVLSLNYIAFFIRILHVFTVNKALGPKLIMIVRMMQDLVTFFIIMLVFIVSYAIASHAILFPNAEMEWSLIISVLSRPYWNLYGELGLEDIEGQDPNSCTDNRALYLNNTLDRCPSEVGTYIVPVLMGIYMLVSNVLLLNLIIAMFSNVVQRVQDNTDMHWYLQRYHLIHEYYNRPRLPPPLTLFSHLSELFMYLSQRYCCRCSNTPTSPFRTFNNDVKLGQWETLMAETYQNKIRKDVTKGREQQLKQLSEKTDAVVKRMDEMQRMVTTNTHFPSQNDVSLNKLKKQIDKQDKKFDWIISALRELGATPELPDVSSRKHKSKKRKKSKKLHLIQDTDKQSDRQNSASEC